MNQGYFWTISFIIGIVLVILLLLFEIVVQLKLVSKNTYTFLKKVSNSKKFLNIALISMIIWVSIIAVSIITMYLPAGFRVQRVTYITEYTKVKKISNDNKSVYVIRNQKSKNRIIKLQSDQKIKFVRKEHGQTKVKYSVWGYTYDNDAFSRAFYVLPVNYSNSSSGHVRITVYSDNALSWWHKQKK